MVTAWRDGGRVALVLLVDEARQYVAGRKRCISVFGKRHVALGVIVSQRRVTVFGERFLSAVLHRLDVAEYRVAVTSFDLLPTHVRFFLMFVSFLYCRSARTAHLDLDQTIYGKAASCNGIGLFDEIP